MNTIIKFGLLISLATALVSCGRQSEATADGSEQRARRYLEPQLHIGDTTTNLITKFGKPLRQDETGNHELVMDFFFPDTDQAALAAGVGGFTGFFTNNMLAHWEPIYRR
jgi:hypothetical protein